MRHVCALIGIPLIQKHRQAKPVCLLLLSSCSCFNKFSERRICTPFLPMCSAGKCFIDASRTLPKRLTASAALQRAFMRQMWRRLQQATRVCSRRQFKCVVFPVHDIVSPRTCDVLPQVQLMPLLAAAALQSCTNILAFIDAGFYFRSDSSIFSYTSTAL